MARSLYKYPADYVIVGKLRNIRDVQRLDRDIGQPYMADVEVVETIRGAGTFHASRLRFVYLTHSCDFKQPQEGTILIIGVDRGDPVPRGRWWEMPRTGVIEALERIGKARAGA